MTQQRPASPRPIRRLFIASRGEIAMHVRRAGRSLGIHAAAAVSAADRAGLATTHWVEQAFLPRRKARQLAAA